MSSESQVKIDKLLAEFIIASEVPLKGMGENNFSVSMTIIDMVVPKHSKVLI